MRADEKRKTNKDPIQSLLGSDHGEWWLKATLPQASNDKRANSLILE